LIQKLGGKCSKCGSTEHLEFDHISPNDKSFNISKLLNRSKQETDIELQKCQLLCHNCHLEKSRKDISIQNSGEHNYFYNKHGKDFPSSKPVIDLDTGKEYESATEFAREFGLNPNCVTRVCRGKQKSIHGFHIRYK
jgi:hypothetical protein